MFPFPQPALIMIRSSQMDSTPTSPSARITFADMYETHPPTVATYCTTWYKARPLN